MLLNLPDIKVVGEGEEGASCEISLCYLGKDWKHGLEQYNIKVQIVVQATNKRNEAEHAAIVITNAIQD